MPERSPRLRAQIDDLKRKQQQLQDRVDRTPERLPIVTERRNPRLAITAHDPNTSTYPSSPADTYWIIFVDSTYDNTDDGQQAITTTERQALAKTTARSLVGEYIEKDTLVEVIWDNGRWWISKTMGFTLQLYEITLEDTGEQDTIQWDATIGAFYVWGKPVDETAEPMVIDGAADEEQLWITAQYRDQESRVDGLSSFAVGYRVYTTMRNGRREIVAPLFHDPRWEMTLNADANTMEYGFAMRAGGAHMLDNAGGLEDGMPVMETARGSDTYGAGYILLNRIPMLNSPRSAENLDLGRATFATDRPFWAAIDTGVNVAYYDAWLPCGTIPNSPYLWPGLPGFVSLGLIRADDDGESRLLVMRDFASKSWWARADGDWVANGDQPYVNAHPSIFSGPAAGIPYDGSGAYPDVPIRVMFYKMGTQQDPNIHDGDFFLYSSHSNTDFVNDSDFVAVGNYLDGFVGEIRFILTARRGWALANGVANSVANGGTGFNYIGANGNFIRMGAYVPGGALTHAHTVSSGANVLASGADVKIDASTHLPPFYGMLPYERIH